MTRWRRHIGRAPATGAYRRRSLRGACVGVLFLSLASAGWTSVASGDLGAPGGSLAPTSLLADPGACRPGRLEAFLNDWLVRATRAEFESEYAAIAFDELVAMVAVLRDVAQDFCV